MNDNGAMSQYIKVFYYINGWAICHCLRHIFADWGWGSFFYRSMASRDSFYYRVFIPAGPQSEIFFIRFSDHEPGKRSGERSIAYDVSITKARKNTTTYPKLIVHLAKQYGKAIPAWVIQLLDNDAYRQLRIWQQENSSRRERVRGDRFYVVTSPALFPNQEV